MPEVTAVAPGTATTQPPNQSPSDSHAAVLLHQRAGGVSLLLELRPDRLPVVLHWGRDLGDLGPTDAAAVRAPAAGRLLAGIVPESQPGWPSRPGVLGSRSGRGWLTGFGSVRARLLSGALLSYGDLVETGPDTLIVQATDTEAGLDLDLAIQLTPTGLLRCRAGVTNRGEEVYQLDSLDIFLPVGDAGAEWLDLGSPGAARLAGRLPLARADGSGPALVGVGATGAGYRSGSVWLAHVAFSGAHRLRLERSSTGIGYLGGGELLAPGEIRLAGGAAYHTPWVCGAWGDGLDAAAGRFHDQLRAGREQPAKPHPIVFDASGPAFADHDQHALLKLAEYAAAVGAEAIVVDVAWCARLGLDPYADSDSGGHSDRLDDLERLLTRLRRYGLQPGLAIAPEVVAADSEITAEHPEWLLASAPGPDGGRLLDLAIRPAMVHAWERLTKLLDRHRIGYLVWRCDPTSTPARGYQGEPTVHARTLATYRLLDALRERYPQLQIQAVSADLALGTRVQSMTAAAPEDIVGSQSALADLLPVELIGSRLTDAAEPGASATSVPALMSAFFGQFGLALDLPGLPPAELRLLHRWLTVYKELRGTLAAGRLVRQDAGDHALQVTGIVAADAAEAVYALAWRERSGSARAVRFAGLDPARRYRVSPVAGRQGDPYAPLPPWPYLDLGGSALEHLGVLIPDAPRGSGLLLRVEMLRDQG
jgi:alpha-galactosidase